MFKHGVGSRGLNFERMISVAIQPLCRMSRDPFLEMGWGLLGGMFPERNILNGLTW